MSLAEESLLRQKQELVQAEASQAEADAKARQEEALAKMGENEAEELRKEKLRQFKAERESQRYNPNASLYPLLRA